MKNLLIIVIFMANIINCKSQNIINYQLMDLQWKNSAIEGLTKKYSSYIKPRLIETNNNYAADIHYKISDLNRYPFGIGVQNLQKSIKKYQIEFDSIVCITNQVVGFNPEQLTGNSYYVYFKDKITHSFIHDPDSYEIIKNEVSNNELELIIARKHSKKDGNNQSLIVFTIFDKNWNFGIYKFVINSDNIW